MCTLTVPTFLQTVYICHFLARLLVNVKGEEDGWLELTALTLEGLIYNICDLFDEQLQQQTIAAAAAAARGN